jgi:hypothetical protein
MHGSSFDAQIMNYLVETILDPSFSERAIDEVKNLGASSGAKR